MIQVVIDERESDLFGKCADLMESDYAPELRPPIKEVLHVGDICLRNAEGRDVCIVERKSLTDLKASIRDARYEEQSYRLLHAGGLSPHDIVYIIEGAMSTVRSAKDKKTVYSAMTSLNAFKGFSVLRTNSVQETAELVLSMASKYERNAKKGIFPASMTASGGGPPASYCTVVKKVKKENVSIDNFAEIVLSQIPGVSATAAVAIMQKFSSFHALLQSLQTDPTCLAGITVPSGARQRAIGKNVVAGIFKYLGQTPAAAAAFVGETDAPTEDTGEAVMSTAPKRPRVRKIPIVVGGAVEMRPDASL
jgi:ERCC4-type nuclease